MSEAKYGIEHMGPARGGKKAHLHINSSLKRRLEPEEERWKGRPSEKQRKKRSSRITKQVACSRRQETEESGRNMWAKNKGNILIK